MTTKNTKTNALPQMTVAEFEAMNSAITTLSTSATSKAAIEAQEDKAKERVAPILAAILSRLKDGGKQVLSLQLKSERKPVYDKAVMFTWLSAPSRLGVFSRLLQVRKDATQTIITYLEIARALRMAYEAYASQTENGTMIGFLTDNAALVAPFLSIMVNTIQSPADLLELNDSAVSAEIKAQLDRGGVIAEGRLHRPDDLGVLVPTLPVDAITETQSVTFLSKGASYGAALLDQVELTDTAKGTPEYEELVSRIVIPF